MNVQQNSVHMLSHGIFPSEGNGKFCWGEIFFLWLQIAALD